MTTPWIINVSKDHLVTAPDADILIQIANPGETFVEYNKQYTSVIRMNFFGGYNNPRPDLDITDYQAKSIAGVLIQALRENKNVVVQCVSGSARSGAIAQVGIDNGFIPINQDRKPSKLVYEKVSEEFRRMYK